MVTEVLVVSEAPEVSVDSREEEEHPMEPAPGQALAADRDDPRDPSEVKAALEDRVFMRDKDKDSAVKEEDSAVSREEEEHPTALAPGRTGDSSKEVLEAAGKTDVHKCHFPVQP
uniref:Uncharacterized protein n=1 Tax=Graphocephala atropunctata TaxID=36148 RepID=A0A1B6KKS2_9HEMI